MNQWGPYYGPWGAGQGPPSVQYIPVPPGTDIERVMKLLDKLEKRRTKKEAEAKKKEDEKKKPKTPEAPKVNILTVFLLMMTFGLPAGYLNLALMQMAAEGIKALLK